MFHVKKYIRFIAVLTLMSCSQTLIAMKETQKIIEIKDHKIEITKYIKKTKNIIIPESLKVIYAPFLKQKSDSSYIIPINTKKVLFFDGASTKIWDLTHGKEYAFFKSPNISVVPVTKLTNDTIFFRNIGGFTIWNFEKNTQKTFSMKNNQNYVTTALQLTETTIATIDNDGVMDIIDLQNGCCLKSIPSRYSELNLLHLSKTTLLSIKTAPYGSDVKIEETILWDLEKNSNKIISYAPKIFNTEITSITATPNQIFAIGQQTGLNGSIQIFDAISTNFIQKIKLYNTSSEFLLHLPDHNVLVSCNKKFHKGENRIEIKFWNLKNPAKKELKIKLHKFLNKNNDMVVSMTYHEKENTIMITTENGFIITMQCKEPEKSKDLLYLFQNLNISKDKKSFKDLGFKFKYNYDTEN